MQLRLGLVSVSFRQYSPEQILKTMHACGLDCIEWGSDIHAPVNDVSALQEIAALQRKYNITCAAYGTYFRIGVNPVEELEAYIEAAKLLGTDVLRLWCGSKDSQDYTAPEKGALFAACRTLAEIAGVHGVTLCMECHGGTFTNRGTAALELMAAVDSPHFRMYWQPNQYETKAENLRYAAAIAPYTVNIHVFNWQKDDRLPLGQAKACWQAYLQQFDGSQGLLLEFMPDGKLETLLSEAEALKEIVK